MVGRIPLQWRQGTDDFEARHSNLFLYCHGVCHLACCVWSASLFLGVRVRMLCLPLAGVLSWQCRDTRITRTPWSARFLFFVATTRIQAFSHVRHN